MRALGVCTAGVPWFLVVLWALQVSALPVLAQSVTRFPIPRLGSNPTDITPGADGNLWFTEFGTSRIGRITPAGILTEFRLPVPYPGTDGEGPLSITAGGDGNLWFTLPWQGKMGRITLEGDITLFSLPDPDSFPTAISDGPDGNVWFTEWQANKIGRITPAGEVVEFALPTGASLPSAITTGPDGALWFLENGQYRIGRISTDGVIQEFAFPVSGSSDGDIVTGPDGALWFATQDADVIGRLTTKGSALKFDVDDQRGDITRGPDGNLWFTTSSGIARISTTGSVTAFDTGSRRFSPHGITTGPDGNLWFVESEEGQIVRFHPPPTPTPAPTRPPVPQQIYVGQSGGTTTVIDAATMQVVATIPHVHGPMTSSPDGTKVYANCGGLCAIDTLTNRIIAHFGLSAEGLAYVTPSSETVYGPPSGFYDPTIPIIDATELIVVGGIPAPYCPTGMTMHPDASLLYVSVTPPLCAHSEDDYIQVIDSADGAVVRNIPAASPGSLAVTPDGRFLYSIETTGYQGSLSAGIRVRELGGDEIVAQFGASSASGVVMNGAASEAYVSAGRFLVVMDLTTNNLAAEVEMTGGRRARQMAVATDGRLVYIATWSVEALVTFDVEARRFTHDIPLGDLPDGVAVAFNPDITPPPTPTSTATATATFRTPPQTATPTPTLSLALDCDRDGVIDTVQIDADPNQDCNGNRALDICDTGFRMNLSSVAYAAGPTPRSVAAADFDGDGDSDLAVANAVPGQFAPVTTVAVLYNAGERTFSAPALFESGKGTRFVTETDIDGDEDVDLIAANPAANTLAVLRNDGHGTFGPREETVLNYAPLYIATGDIDGDADVDLVIAHAPKPALSVMFNDGSGRFPKQVLIPLEFSRVLNLALADFDNDGDLDLAVPGQSQSYLARIWWNNGMGSFGTRYDVPGTAGPGRLVAGDLDGDGIPDLAIAKDVSGPVSIVINDGTGVFAVDGLYVASDRVDEIGAGDVDGDGDLDLLTADQVAGTISILRNNGAGAFALPLAFVVGPSPSAPRVADLDGDGFPDVAAASERPDRVSVLWNEGAQGVLQPTSSDCNLNSIPDECEVASADCDGNGVPDDCDPDRDADGVPDTCDRCPGADDLRDADRDGTPDCLDGCPTDPDKIDPGGCGCFHLEPDADGDTVSDCADNCLQEPNPLQEDTDGDQTGDACDDCPKDPAKTTPGLCGCGFSDTDSDKDGVLDCHDGCLLDPAKVAPGFCGCGASEAGAVDSDGDGVLDCHDQCPETDDHLDTDGDGVPDCRDRCPMDASVPASGGPVIYVTNKETGTVTVVEPSSAMIQGTIPVGTEPGFVAFSPDGARAYVTNAGSDDISVIDTEIRSVVGRIEVGPTPGKIAITRDGRRAYVVTASKDASPATVSVLETASGALLTSIHFAATPADMAIAAAADVAAVADFSTRTLSIINTTTNSVARTIDERGRAVALRADGRQAYVLSYSGGPIPPIDIHVIDTQTGEQGLTIRGRPEFLPNVLAASRDGTRAYVGNSSGVGVYAFDLVNPQVSAYIHVGAKGITVSADASEAYIAESETVDCPPEYCGLATRGTLHIYSEKSRSVRDAVSVGAGAVGIAVSADLAGDANCDGLVTAPDATALLQLIASHARASCRYDDANRDCNLDLLDSTSVVHAMFTP